MTSHAAAFLFAALVAAAPAAAMAQASDPRRTDHHQLR